MDQNGHKTAFGRQFRTQCITCMQLRTKFSGVSEIGDLRQDKAENSDEIWMLQLFGKVFLCMNTAFVS